MGSKHCLLLNTFTFEQCVQWLHLSHWPQFTNSTVYTSGDIFLHTQHRSSSGISDNRSLSLSALSNSCGCCCSPEVVACGWVEEMLIDGLAFPLFALCFVGFFLFWVGCCSMFISFSTLFFDGDIRLLVTDWCFRFLSVCTAWVIFLLSRNVFGGSFSFSFSLYISDGAVFSCDILVGSNGVYARFSISEVRLAFCVVYALKRPKAANVKWLGYMWCVGW